MNCDIQLFSSRLLNVIFQSHRLVSGDIGAFDIPLSPRADSFAKTGKEDFQWRIR
jgi:hypothetical protein